MNQYGVTFIRSYERQNQSRIRSGVNEVFNILELLNNN